MTSVNAIVVGETGVGKSSIINLIAGRQVADISSDAQVHTVIPKSHSLIIGGKAFHVWDTAGLDQPDEGTVVSTNSVIDVLELIGQLGRRGGVDLLLFCIRGKPVTITTQGNYRLFDEVLCHLQVPIALVITCLEREQDMDGWWLRNEETLAARGIKPARHACVTGLPRHSRHAQSKANIERMLGEHEVQRSQSTPRRLRLIELLRSLWLSAPESAPPKKNMAKNSEELYEILTERFQRNERITPQLAEGLWMARKK